MAVMLFFEAGRDVGQAGNYECSHVVKDDLELTILLSSSLKHCDYRPVSPPQC